MEISDNIFTFQNSPLNYEICRYGNNRLSKNLQWNDSEQKIYLLLHPSIYHRRTENKFSKTECVFIKSSYVMKVSCLMQIFISNFTPTRGIFELKMHYILRRNTLF